jgi:hypothetical protein
MQKRICGAEMFQLERDRVAAVSRGEIGAHALFFAA